MLLTNLIYRPFSQISREMIVAATLRGVVYRGMVSPQVRLKMVGVVMQESVEALKSLSTAMVAQAFDPKSELRPRNRLDLSKGFEPTLTPFTAYAALLESTPRPALTKSLDRLTPARPLTDTCSSLSGTGLIHTGG